MAAPLIVRTAEDAAADVQELTVLLHDFSFRDPAEILAGLTGAKDTKPGGTMPGMSMPADAPDLNDIEYDAYLANDRTLADPSVIRVEPGRRVRLRLINGATSTAFWIDLGALEGTVVAVDGNPVKPLQAKTHPDGAGPAGRCHSHDPTRTAARFRFSRSGKATGSGRASSSPRRVQPWRRCPGMRPGRRHPSTTRWKRQLQALAPLGPRAADVVHKVELSGAMMPYSWLMDGRTWAGHLPLRVSKGQRVEMEISNRSAMAHPMHLHGHHFQVTALNGTHLSGAVRDTVLVPANGSVRVAFDADNPGRWLFHCHNLYHMAVGMMSEVRYDAGRLEQVQETGSVPDGQEVGHDPDGSTRRRRRRNLEQSSSVTTKVGGALKELLRCRTGAADGRDPDDERPCAPDAPLPVAFRPRRMAVVRRSRPGRRYVR